MSSQSGMRQHGMSSVKCQISISVDGFVAGPNQSLENPIGEGGMRLHEWVFGTASWRELQGLDGGSPSADSDVISEAMAGIGAHIMGRKMFGGGDGPWDETWTGWWGDDPPFHKDVFVLTHHERAPLSLHDTTFFFVRDGVESALKQARASADGKDVAIAGGGSVVRQYLAAGLLDELYLHIVPIVLGAGERIFDDVGDVVFEPANVVASPGVTHIKYRVVR
ncbi:MAG TPA: dihydrofolate reductase family protein [Acidothermaceae bacterium]